MKSTITVREYARLTTSPLTESTLDRVQIPQSAFDWVCRTNAKLSRGGTALVQVEDQRWLKLDSYVGVLETPCGTRIEILPKREQDASGAAASRVLLRRMITAAMDLPAREVGEAGLDRFETPITEWVMARFLAAVDHLVKRGVRSDYVRIEESERFLRGQLDVTRQMRQPPSRRHVFNVRHDVFVPDRAENRLIKLAVERICLRTRDPANWRLAQELRALLLDVPKSPDTESDFRRWHDDRLMTHYKAVKPWCELVLSRQMPMALAGEWHGISLLFPMEKLFERYVAEHLPRSLAVDAIVETQARSQYLCRHDSGSMFQLRPDLLVRHRESCWVLDTKWKLVDANARGQKYGLSQADFYQLFAYGQKYLGGEGEVVLLYPRHQAFRVPLPIFRFDDRLSLWVLPFDLDTGSIVGGEGTGLPMRGYVVEDAA
ncbi:McrC family protein [Cupriavidus sp. Marseille-Q8015]